jgi:GntR family transcriptional regulator/MocR family aminotransferase
MLIPLSLERNQPLQQQLYTQLHALIATGRLRPGARMPSTRMMAEQFAVSRITVLLTYERLIAEGLLETRPAQGTFVARLAARHADAPIQLDTERAARAVAAHAGEQVGRPDPSLFPVGRWRSLMRTALDNFGANVGSDHPAGHPGLRSAIAHWLSASRGLVVSSDQILVFNGRQQALHVIAHLTQHQTGPAARRIVVEDPCDPSAAATLQGDGAELIRVRVDAGGLCTDELPAGQASLLHVTPEHQRPLGVSLHRSRRRAVLDWAARSGSLVLEEDCEGELRYGDMNTPSLMSLDTADRVILVGGFCVSLGPWVEIAYTVVPPHLVNAARAARREVDDSHGRLEETALAAFMSSGGYARHLHRLGKAYAARRDTLVAALRRHFGDATIIRGEHAGLHLTWYPPASLGASAAVAAALRGCGLDCSALPTRDAPICLGFANLTERQIDTRLDQFVASLPASQDARVLSAD